MLLYRLLLSVFAIAILFRAGVARDRDALRARLGRLTPRSPCPHLWLHAASNGELASARPVIDTLQAARPGQAMLVTCNTRTGVALARGWGLPGLQAELAPLDLGWVTRRVIRQFDVRGLIVMEAELWPNRVRLCPGPVALIGARLTPGTARTWARFGALAGDLLRRLSLIVPQDTASAARLRDLGAPEAVMTAPVTLKALLAANTEPDLSNAPRFDRGQTWLAASTHEGEEDIIAAAHAAALRDTPGLRLILAPRHPARADAVRACLEARGMTVAQRSRRDTPRNGDVYLADTMGEMDLWYAQCGRVFVGGSLTDKGGHTPYEPARFGCALLSGPHVSNFDAAYAALRDAGAVAVVGDATDLAAALGALAQPAAQSAAGQRARAVLGPDAHSRAVLDRIASVFARLS